MSFTLKDGTGNSRVFERLEITEAITRKTRRQAWFGLGQQLRKSANSEILRKPKGGKTYIVRGPSGRKRRHVASAPGETHANRSGTLRKSIGWKVRGTDQMDFGYGIVSAKTAGKAPKYDAWVEFGTRRMAPRPSLANAIVGADTVLQREWTHAMNQEFGQ